MRTATKDIL
jgi:hypothetical protein